MNSDLTPANSNKTLSHFIEDKDRRLIEESLGSTLHLLEIAGMPNSKIGDALFRYLTSTVMPPKGDGDAANIVWYAQLQRFRDELAAQVQAIEDALDGKHV